MLSQLFRQDGGRSGPPLIIFVFDLARDLPAPLDLPSTPYIPAAPMRTEHSAFQLRLPVLISTKLTIARQMCKAPLPEEGGSWKVVDDLSCTVHAVYPHHEPY